MRNFFLGCFDDPCHDTLHLVRWPVFINIRIRPQGTIAPQKPSLPLTINNGKAQSKPTFGKNTEPKVLPIKNSGRGCSRNNFLVGRWSRCYYCSFVRKLLTSRVRKMKVSRADGGHGNQARQLSFVCTFIWTTLLSTRERWNKGQSMKRPIQSLCILIYVYK